LLWRGCPWVWCALPVYCWLAGFEGSAASAARASAGVGPVLRLPLQGAEAIAKVSAGR
jgi:hypothetical protein